MIVANAIVEKELRYLCRQTSELLGCKGTLVPPIAVWTDTLWPHKPLAIRSHGVIWSHGHLAPRILPYWNTVWERIGEVKEPGMAEEGSKWLQKNSGMAPLNWQPRDVDKLAEARIVINSWMMDTNSDRQWPTRGQPCALAWAGNTRSVGIRGCHPVDGDGMTVARP